MSIPVTNVTAAGLAANTSVLALASTGALPLNIDTSSPVSSVLAQLSNGTLDAKSLGTALSLANPAVYGGN